MSERWLIRLCDYPRLVLAATAIITALALHQLVDLKSFSPRFDVDPSMTSLLPRAGPALETLQRARNTFPDDDLLLVAWFSKALFSTDQLARLKNLSQTLERLPGVFSVDSLATAQDVQLNADETRIDRYLRLIPNDQSELLRLRQRAISNPLLSGRIVSAEGDATLLAIRMQPGLTTPELLQRVDAIAAASEAHAGNIEQFVTGPMKVRLELSRLLRHDLHRVMPLAVVVTLMIAILAFRSLRGVVLPLLGNLSAAVVTFALFVASGHQLNFVTVILPPVVYVVGFAYAIHVVSEFDRQFQPGRSRLSAARAALSEVALPLSLTAMTTALAFAALAISNIESIRVFGLFAAVGVVLAGLGAVIVIPAGLIVLPAKPQPAGERAWLSRSAGSLANLANRYRSLMLGAGTLVGVLAVGSSTMITVDTEVLHNFPAESEVRQQFQRVAKTFAGPVPIQVLIEAEHTDAFKQPDNLHAIEQLTEWLGEQAEIGGVYSLVDYVSVLHQAIAPEAARLNRLPESQRAVNHLLLVAGNQDQRQFVDGRFSSTMIHAYARTLSTAAVNRLATRIEQRLQQLPAGLHGQLTGTTYLTARTVDAITLGQVKSLSLALVMVLIVMSVLFRSVRLGLITLVPNALPVIAYFGLLGASSITLNLTTSLVACAVFGIAIDDSVHYLARFRIESRRNTALDASRESLKRILRPVSLTTLALCAGFLALTAGELRSQAEFGLLAAATLFFAWLIDITFTPALCSRLVVSDTRQSPEVTKP